MARRSVRLRGPRRRGGALLVPLLPLLLAGCGDDGPTGPAERFPDQPAPDPPPRAVAFVDVRVVSLDGGGVTPGQTVLVRDGVIEAVGPSSELAPPADAFVVQGFDRPLMAGLADLHVHATEDTFEELRNDYWLYLANGITTVRNMWGFGTMLDERARIEAGEIVGPTLFVASPGLDGPGGTWTAFTPPVATPDEARERVRTHADRGYDFIKVYNDLDPDVYAAIVDEAAAAGVPLVGHVPRRVRIAAVQGAGQRTVEHLIGVKLEASTPYTAGALAMSVVREVAARSATTGTAHTPTLSVMALPRSRRNAIRGGELIDYVAPGVRAFFETGFFHGLDDDVARVEGGNLATITRELDAAGARVLVGTDAGFGWMLPGFSIHDELAALHGAGLSPERVLRAATVDAAAVLGQSGVFGRVEAGLRADLILLEGDPRSDLDVLRDPAGVMVRGRWLSRGTLADRLEQIRRSYGGG